MSIKSAIYIVLIFILILSVLTLSAFAAFASFAPLPDTLTALGSSGQVTFSASLVSGDVSVCWCLNHNDYQGPLFLSSVPSRVHLVRGDSSYTFDEYLDLSYDSDNDIYFLDSYWVPSSLPYSTDLPVYESYSVAVSDYQSWYASSTFSYTLPPGNIAYIPIPRGQSSQIPYTLSATFPMAFGNNDLSRVNQVVTTTTSLPSGSSNYAPSSPQISWVNNGSINLFGTSAHKIYSGTVSNSLGGYYLVVSNPMTMKSESGLIGGDTLVNPSILIQMDAVAGSPIVYPMSDRLVITNGNGIDSESTFGDSGYTYEVDPETGEIIWTDPDGGNSAPVAGGNNPMPTPNTIFDWLRNISQQLSDFLRGPVQAVQVVVSAIRDFMGSFTQLYQWLPSPVYSLITSALMIALTIGVIKIFV